MNFWIMAQADVLEGSGLENVWRLNAINGCDRATFMRNFDEQLDCWIWQGDHLPDGTPCVRIEPRDGKFGQVISASRAGYQLKKGFIPRGRNLRNLCGNSKCVKPEHHALACDLVHSGSRVTDDGKVGNFFNAKLTDETVKAMRVAYCKGLNTYQELAEQYGVSISAVCNAVSGLTWKHVEMPSVRVKKINEKAKLDNRKVKLIYSLMTAGQTYQQIADQVGVSMSTVGELINRKVKKECSRSDKVVIFPPNLVVLAKKYKCRSMEALVKLMGVDKETLVDNYRAGRNLDPLQVKAIRNVFSAGWSIRKISSEFEINRTTIIALLQNKTWTWVK